MRKIVNKAKTNEREASATGRFLPAGERKVTAAERNLLFVGREATAIGRKLSLNERKAKMTGRNLLPGEREVSATEREL